MAEPGPTREELAALRAEVERLNTNLERLNRGLTSMKVRFAVGLATGLGTVLGATLLVSLLLWALRPLTRLPVVDEVVRPAVRTIEEGRGTPGPRVEPSGVPRASEAEGQGR